MNMPVVCLNATRAKIRVYWAVCFSWRPFLYLPARAGCSITIIVFLALALQLSLEIYTLIKVLAKIRPITDLVKMLHGNQIAVTNPPDGGKLFNKKAASYQTTAVLPSTFSTLQRGKE